LETARQWARLRLAFGLPSAYCQRALEPLEPDVPWGRDALLFRRNCYEATGDPRAAAAARDFADFVRDDRPHGTPPPD